jgi:hypothetical protein
VSAVKKPIAPPLQSELELMRDIQLALADVRGLRLWRANVGKGWVGEGKPSVQIVQGKKIVTLYGARPLDTGLPEGFPDLVGFIEVEGLGIFVSIEVKSPKGAVRPRQHAFAAIAEAAGCRSGIARSVEDALRIVRGEHG